MHTFGQTGQTEAAEHLPLTRTHVMLRPHTRRPTQHQMAGGLHRSSVPPPKTHHRAIYIHLTYHFPLVPICFLSTYGDQTSS